MTKVFQATDERTEMNFNIELVHVNPKLTLIICLVATSVGADSPDNNYGFASEYAFTEQELEPVAKEPFRSKDSILTEEQAQVVSKLDINGIALGDSVRAAEQKLKLMSGGLHGGEGRYSRSDSFVTYSKILPHEFTWEMELSNESLYANSETYRVNFAQPPNANVVVSVSRLLDNRRGRDQASDKILFSSVRDSLLKKYGEPTTYDDPAGGDRGRFSWLYNRKGELLNEKIDNPFVIIGYYFRVRDEGGRKIVVEMDASMELLGYRDGNWWAGVYRRWLEEKEKRVQKERLDAAPIDGKKMKF